MYTGIVALASQTDSIITVHTDSMDDAQRVADILDDNGAVNVDERDKHTQYDNNADSNRTGLLTTDDMSDNTRYNATSDTNRMERDDRATDDGFNGIPNMNLMGNSTTDDNQFNASDNTNTKEQ